MPRTGRSVLGSAASKGRITGGAKSQEGLVMASNKTPTGNTAPLICFIPGMNEHIKYVYSITQCIPKRHPTILIHVSTLRVQLNDLFLDFFLFLTFRFPLSLNLQNLMLFVFVFLHYGSVLVLIWP